MKLKLVDFDFGITTDPEVAQAAREFRLAALADGWHSEPIVQSSEPPEVRDHLYRGHKDKRWTLHILVRDEGSNTDGDNVWTVNVSAWAPDGLSVLLPVVYEANVIRANVRRCNVCEAEDVDTTRYSFAGRCCEPCGKLPEQNGFYTG